MGRCVALAACYGRLAGLPGGGQHAPRRELSVLTRQKRAVAILVDEAALASCAIAVNRERVILEMTAQTYAKFIVIAGAVPAESMMARFKKGIGFTGWRRPRGPGRGTYRMSRAAYGARRNNLRKRRTEGLRTWEDTRRLELEIALATHRGESYRAMAKRLGCSHVYCHKVARRYRAGLTPLPPTEQELVALRDSLDAPPASGSEQPARNTATSICLRCGMKLAGPYALEYVPFEERCKCHGSNCKCATCGE